MTGGEAWGDTRGDALPYAMIVAAALILASNHIIARYFGGVIPPMGMVFWRMAIGAAVLLPLTWRELVTHRRLLIMHWRLFGLLALLFVPLGNGGIYLAYNWTTALNGGVVSTVQPAITVLLSALLFRDLITWKQGAGILIAAAGVMVIISRGDPASLLRLEPNLGDLLMLVAISFVALHNVLLRQVPREISTLTLMVAVQVVGIAVTLPLYVAESLLYQPVIPTWEAVGALLWIGIAVTSIAVGLTNTAVRLIGANKASMANYVRAVFTALLAILLLGEVLETFHAVALVLVIGGVYLMTRGRRPNRTSLPAATRPEVSDRDDRVGRS